MRHNTWSRELWELATAWDERAIKYHAEVRDMRKRDWCSDAVRDYKYGTAFALQSCASALRMRILRLEGSPDNTVPVLTPEQATHGDDDIKF